ncbi:YqaA family protein [Metapseudomonas otitidis]|uniref:YqaA family protein n=1 Tax=Metapseudomonas otitidis TaxID=319939 RepID=UPI0025400435|nr:YqaA family protein [Pseudomonas otitidis]WIF67000.1 YqaA family protein [Pseudomonas otitidis]
MPDLLAYTSLFLAAFGAATLLPLQSEAVLLGLLLNGAQPTWALLLVATVGNVLGSLVNWLLGRYLADFRRKRWFPVSESAIERARRNYLRYGRWTLLLSWLPIVGDPLTLVAGLMRESLGVFLLLVLLAKAGRYAVVAALALGWG